MIAEGRELFCLNEGGKVTSLATIDMHCNTSTRIENIAIKKLTLLLRQTAVSGSAYTLISLNF